VRDELEAFRGALRRREESSLQSDLIVITCQDCDASFEVVEDRRYWLKRYVDEPCDGEGVSGNSHIPQKLPMMRVRMCHGKDK
jgi:hypothetical protein